jgi:membrane fusion protein, multidrug efflux system
MRQTPWTLRTAASRRGFKQGATLVIIALLIFGATAANAFAAEQQYQGQSVLVQLTRLREGSLPRVVTAYGRIATDPAAERTMTAPAAAVVGAIDVRPGQQVTEGAPLVRLTPSPASAAAYAQAVSAVRVGSDLARRTRALVGQHLATEQELAAAEKTAADAHDQLAALTAEGAGGPQTLRAPFAATVTAVPASPGAIVVAGASLVELAPPHALVLRVGVTPAQAAAIRPGDRVAVTALGGRDTAAGKVLWRGFLIDSQTELVPVIIAPPNGRFLLGEMAQARIVTGEARGWVVPHSAILVDDSGTPYVVQAKDKTARRVQVHILGSDGDRDVVAGSLDPTAPLVLAGAHQLADGMRVRTK